MGKNYQIMDKRMAIHLPFMDNELSKYPIEDIKYLLDSFTLNQLHEWYFDSNNSHMRQHLKEYYKSRVINYAL